MPQEIRDGQIVGLFPTLPNEATRTFRSGQANMRGRSTNHNRFQESYRRTRLC